jgi:hypothetical protein
MLRDRAAPDTNSVAKPLGERAPCGPSHPRILVVVAVRVPRRQVEQLVPRVVAAKAIGKLQLESRIRLNARRPWTAGTTRS